MLRGAIFFDEGDLYAREACRILRFRGWPEPGAWAGPSKHSCRTEFEARLSYRDFEVRSWALDKPDIKAIETFLATIPRQERDVVSRFPEFLFPMLRLVWEARDPALELIESNPALAFAVAVAPKLKTHPGENGWKTPAELVQMKRRNILEWLEFPAGKSTVKLLGRVIAPTITLKRVRWLRALLHGGNSTVRKALNHGESLNAEVLTIVRDPRLFAQVTGNFLEEVSTVPVREVFYADRLQKVVASFDTVLEMRCPVFNSVAELDATIKDLRRLTAFKRRLDFFKEQPMPPPAVPGNGNIVPLDSFSLLVEESRVQRNCSHTYFQQVNCGRFYLYKVELPERCTLSLERRGRGWDLAELKAKANRYPDKRGTYRVVRRWLQDNGCGHRQGTLPRME